MKVSFIIGAGFSRNAGLPLASEIWDKLSLNDLEEQLLHFGSSEWKWKDTASEADQINGRISSERIPIGLTLKFALEKFKETTENERHNYEEFYQWILDLDPKGSVLKSLTDKTRKCLVEDFGSNGYYSVQPITKRDLIFCFIHLIDDLLWPRKPFDDYAPLYSPYLDLIQNPDNEVNIYTLNHDLIIETLFEDKEIPFSDGFSTKNSQLQTPEKKEPIPIFCNAFEERVKLIKLHGSINLHKYHYLAGTDKAGETDYFKTLDYHAKHTAEYVNKEGIVQQSYTTEIEPQFMTGRNKLNLMQQDNMYSALYKNFESELPESDLLIIVGYSYLDPHVNTVIESAKDSIATIININPGAVFPDNHHNIRNINPLKEEINLSA